LLDLAFNIRGPEREQSSKPNESDIVNRQSGGEKLKYVLKFYIRGTHHVISRMRNDDSALCLLWTQWYLGQNISETVRDWDLGPKDNQQEMAHRQSNGHVTDDVTW